MSSRIERKTIAICLLAALLSLGPACWSPDGQKIAFTAEFEADRRPQLWVMNPDGSNLERLTNNKHQQETFIDWRDPSFVGISPLLKAVKTSWGKIKSHP